MSLFGLLLQVVYSNMLPAKEARVGYGVRLADAKFIESNRG